MKLREHVEIIKHYAKIALQECVLDVSLIQEYLINDACSYFEKYNPVLHRKFSSFKIPLDILMEIIEIGNKRGIFTINESAKIYDIMIEIKEIITESEKKNTIKLKETSKNNTDTYISKKNILMRRMKLLATLKETKRTILNATYHHHKTEQDLDILFDEFDYLLHIFNKYGMCDFKFPDDYNSTCEKMINILSTYSQLFNVDMYTCIYNTLVFFNTMRGS